MSPKFTVRGPDPDDLNFILSTWLRGLYYGCDFLNKHVEKDPFMRTYEPMLKHLLVRKNTAIRVAALPDDESVILGYSVVEKNVLHWVFVKDAWRKMGIAKQLLMPHDIKAISQATDLGWKLKKPRWKFNPFAILGE